MATSAAGVKRGTSRTFTTGKAPTAVALTPSTIRPVWGTGITFTGSVTGAGSLTVALEKQDWPYTGPFTQIATASANSRGAFKLSSPPLLVTARLRVLTRTAVVAASPVTTASVAVKVGATTRRLKRKRVRMTGAIWPAVAGNPNAKVSLQRQTRAGNWGYVKRARAA